MTHEIVPLVPSEGPSFRSRMLTTLLPNGKEGQEQLADLTGQVVRKLLSDIAEYGKVSIFDDKETGTFDKAIFTLVLTSPKIPYLEVMIWKEDTHPTQPDMELEKKHFGVYPERVAIDVFEMSPSRTNRGVAVVQRWDSEAYETIYRRDCGEESGNNPKPRSNREKIRFLREILETNVDTVMLEKRFGRPYVKDESWGTPDDPTSRTRHHAHWVRDIRNRVTGLLPGGHNKRIE